MAPCKTCSTETPKYCTGCFDTYFCSGACQKINRNAHKTHCDAVADRLAVTRTAELGRSIFFMIKEAFWMYKIAKVDSSEKRIIVYEPVLKDQEGIAIVPLPRFESDRDKRAVLSIDGCSVGVAWIELLLRALLQHTGLARYIDEASVTMNKQPRPAFNVEREIPAEGSHMAQSRHVIVCLEMKKSKTAWVVDVSGAQYGFDRMGATKLQDYIVVCGIQPTWTTHRAFGVAKRAQAMRVRYRLDHPTNRCANISASRIDRVLSTFTYDGKILAHFLQKGEVVWNKAMTAFLAAAQECIQEHLKELHAPGGPLRKNISGESIVKLEYFYGLETLGNTEDINDLQSMGTKWQLTDAARLRYRDAGLTTLDGFGNK